MHTAMLGLVLVLSAGLAFGAPPTAAVWVVSPAGGDFQRIQDAIDVVDEEGVVVVRPGIYRENLTIDRPLTLLGVAGAVLEPANAARPAIAVDGAERVAILGLEIDRATIGCSISGGSCTISGCSIRASEAGIRITAFVGDAASIVATTVRGADRGVGVSIVGSGAATLAGCDFASLGTAVLVGGTGTALVQGCTVEGCFDAVVLAVTARVVLSDDTIRGNHADGVRLASVPFPADVGSLVVCGCTIEDNGGWGLSLCGADDGVGIADAFGSVLGIDNRLVGNERGDVCPQELALPEGFLRP